MSSDSWNEDPSSAGACMTRSVARARNSVRLRLPSVIQTGLLFALTVTLVVLTREPAPEGNEPLAWSIRTGHPRGVRAVAFAPDGRRLATGGFDGSLVIWEVGKGFERELWHERRSRVICAAFSPDGTTVASGHDNSTCVLWDATTGEKRATLAGNTHPLLCLAFSPDGATLATGGGEPSVRLWDVASGKPKADLRGHIGSVCSVRFSPDGRTLASGCTVGWVKLWDLRKGKCRVSIGANNKGTPVMSLMFSPGGLRLASGGICDHLRTWDVATGLEQEASPTEVQNLREVVYSADGQMSLTLAYNDNVRIRCQSTGYERTVRLGNLITYCSAFSPDGRSLALGDQDGTVRVWELNREKRDRSDIGNMGRRFYPNDLTEERHRD
jgi:WD40 repeat protein